MRRSIRILRDTWGRRGLKENYWALLDTVAGVRALYRPANREFRRIVRDDLGAFFSGRAASVADAPDVRARAALAWLTRAQDATDDDGVSFGYFPCDADGGWHTSYPETTGYIIVSLLDYVSEFGGDELVDRARRMAHWEVDVQMSTGAVQGGRLDSNVTPTPAAFNTGMVLHGWARLLDLERDPRIFEAATRAADFLVSDMTPDGDFRTNGQFVSAADSKKYNSLCGWAMCLFAEVSGQPSYAEAGIRAAEAAMRAQHDNGWIEKNSLGRADAVLTHTLGYSLQAMLEVGSFAKRDDLVAAARKGIDAVESLVTEDGFLCSWFYANWEPALFSSCLTGSAQLAIVMYRFADLHGDDRYLAVADRLVSFLKARQVIDTSDPGVRGALPGSYPILGQYMTRGYPNWATKYLLDALLLQNRIRS